MLLRALQYGETDFSRLGRWLLVFLIIFPTVAIVSREAIVEAGVLSSFHSSIITGLASVGMMNLIVMLLMLQVLRVERSRDRAKREAITALATAEAASRAKSEFLANMSHELRTPLNAILGFSELMRGEERGEDGMLHVDPAWAAHIQEGGEHLLELVNDVLDLSRIEAGRLELVLETIDVGEAIGSSVEQVRPLAEAKGQTISSAPLPERVPIEADRTRLGQIVLNLLSNAIKYTPEGGRIDVALAPRGADLAISVTDTGIGIEPEDQARIFSEFWQAGAVGTAREGIGLGLGLARRLVEAHHGHIEVASTPGEGSRFTVVLPERQPDLTEAGVEPVVEADAPGPDGGGAAAVGGAPGGATRTAESSLNYGRKPPRDHAG